MIEDSDLGMFANDNGHNISYDLVREAMAGESYPARFSRDDGEYVEAAVGQGIDSRLEACYVPARGDDYTWGGGFLHCTISPESMPVLLRRLFESDSEENEGEPGQLASDILTSLGIDEYGKLVGREVVGLE